MLVMVLEGQKTEKDIFKRFWFSHFKTYCLLYYSRCNTSTERRVLIETKNSFIQYYLCSNR